MGQGSLVITVLFCLILSPLKSQGGLFQITDRTYGNVPQEFQTEIDAIFNSLETEVNANLPTSTAATYLTGISNSAALANSANGVDYSSGMQLFMLGVTGGMGADLGGASMTKATADNIAGFAGIASLTLGLRPGMFIKKKIGYFDMERARVYINWFDRSMSFDTVTMKTSTLGLHLQYKVLPEQKYGYGSLKWAGVDVTTGFRTSSTSIRFQKSVVETFTDSIDMPPTVSLTANFAGDVDLGAEYSVNTIPIEVSTAVRFLWVWSLFTGVGVDFQSGSAKSVATLNGPVSVESSPGLISGVGATAKLDLGEKSGPKPAYPRYFLGTQFEFGVLSFFVQYTAYADNSAVGGSGGLRFYW